VLGVVLALAKLFSVHSLAKADSAVVTLVVSVLLAGVGLGALHALGRRWRVAGARPVVIALALYACAAIGLDAVTWLIAAVQAHSGALSAAAATFVEELGEALSALVLLVTVRWQLAAVRRPPSPQVVFSGNAPWVSEENRGQSVRQQ
jgi:fumarate reductase subunit C